MHGRQYKKYLILYCIKIDKASYINELTNKIRNKIVFLVDFTQRLLKHKCILLEDKFRFY